MTHPDSTGSTGSTALTRLRLDYRAAFTGYLTRRGEPQLRSAYELGRQALTHGIGLLDLIHIHNTITLDLLQAAPAADDRLDIAHAAATFLTEVLASADMTQRGFLERARRPREED